MPCTITAKELREQRKSLIQKAQLYLEQHTDEDGNAKNEDLAEFDRMMADAQAKEDMAKRLESLEEARASTPVDNSGREIDEPAAQQFISVRSGHDANGNPHYTQIPVSARGSEAYRDAFRSYLSGRLRPEQRAALQSDDADQAGYLLASEQLASGILKAVDDLLFIRRYAKIHTVREADSLGIRKRTAVMETWAWSSELAVSTEDSTLAYGKKILTPHHATGLIKLSRDLIRRSTISVEEQVRMEMARDAGELMEDAYLTGNGSQQPLGVFTASTDGISTGRDVETGSTTSITADALIDAKYALKSQYRNGGPRQGCRWLFHRDAVKIIAKLKDADNHYLFRPGQGLRGDDPDFLLGFPVDESERVPNTFTASQYVGLLANWQYYEIADSLDMSMQVLNELYAATNQVGIIGRIKTDGLPTLEEAFVRLITDAS